MKVVKRKDITEITLLSVEEYRAAEDNIPPLNGWWWLRSPGNFGDYAACVHPSGDVRSGSVRIARIGVRPALRFDPASLNLRIREKVRLEVRLGDFTWTCVSGGILLCDSIITQMPFRKDRQTDDVNNYEASDVKAFLDKWLDAEKKTVVEKQIISYVKTAIEITDISILSVEEYKTAKDNIPTLNDWWWLRSPGFVSSHAACVVPGGDVNNCGDHVLLDNVGVRPALHINRTSLELQIREKIRLGRFIWTHIAEGILLCDVVICAMPFRKDWQTDNANDYETSDVKAFLDKDVKAFLDKWLNAEKKTVVEKQVTSYVKTAIEITDISILSLWEYREAKNNIPPLNDWWWLRSPGLESNIVACVHPGGDVIRNGHYVHYDDTGVRPALRINPNSLNLQIRNKIRFGDFIWTYVAEGILLCDEIICKMPFRKDWKTDDANDYERSDVKAFLEKWLEDAKRKEKDNSNQ